MMQGAPKLFQNLLFQLLGTGFYFWISFLFVFWILNLIFNFVKDFMGFNYGLIGYLYFDVILEALLK